MRTIHVPRTEWDDYVQSLRSVPVDIVSINVDPEDSACFMVVVKDSDDLELR